MKKICIIDYDMSIRGGVEQVSAALASALADHCEVHLISLCMKSTIPYEIDSRVKIHTLLEKEDRLRVMKSQATAKLSFYFKENDIAVALIQGNYPGFICSSVRFHSKTKLIFCDHGALMNQWHQKDIVVIRAISAHLCHKVVTLTHDSLNAYNRKLLIPKKKLSCIYNWVDDECVHSQKYNKESKKIISAGRFGKEKGFDRLIDAFAIIAKKYPDWKLDLYGDGEMMDVVKEKIEYYSILDNVNLMGMKNGIGEIYKDYAFYVLPSYREGMPLVLLEAKLNRLPIISFDISTGPKEIVQNGVDGILVPDNDIEAFANAMETLISDEKMRKKMSEETLKNLDLFSKKTILAQWINLMEELS